MLFFELTKEWIPKVDECFKRCDAGIRMDEVENALKCLSLDQDRWSNK